MKPSRVQQIVRRGAMAKSYIRLEHSLVIFFTGYPEKSFELIGSQVGGLDFFPVFHHSCSHCALACERKVTQ
jgi:hypothetical protein